MRLGFAGLPLLVLLHQLMLLAASSSVNCPPDWIQFNSSCYAALYSNGKTFLESRAACQSTPGADLLWLDSQEELDWVMEKDRFGIRNHWDRCNNSCGSLQSAWIGMHRVGANPFSESDSRAAANDWVWVRDGNPTELNLPWYFGHPRSSPNDFVSLSESTTSSSRFRTDPQSQRMFSLCKWQSESRRTPCPTSEWLQFNNFCYLLVKGSTGRNLTEALIDCQRRDKSAHLLWVTSETEMAWIMDRAARNWRLREDYRSQCKDCRPGGDAAWTGLYRDVTDGGKFKWMRDNSIVDFKLKWFFTGPLGSPNDNGFLYESSTDLYLNTMRNSAKHYHFCKTPLFTANATTTKPPITTLTDSTTEIQTKHTTTTYTTEISTISNEAGCPTSEWLQFNNFCYLLVKGSTGRNLTEALTDCQRRDKSAHLLWVTSETEMAWIMDYSARNWRLSEDYRNQCKDCRPGANAAWTGIYRDVTDGGEFKWMRDNSIVNVNIKWFFTGPGHPPNNYGFLYDSSAALSWNTFRDSGKHYHFCKMQNTFVTTSISESSTTAKLPTTTGLPSTDQTQTIQQSSSKNPTTKYATTEHATTEHATTEHATTEHATTEHPTTEHPTTEHPTTEHPTSEHPTAEHPTTEHPTTEHPTTEHPTTEHPTTEHPTTEHPTTEHATTEHPTTEHATTNEVTTQSTTRKPQSHSTSFTEAASSSSTSTQLPEVGFAQTPGGIATIVISAIAGMAVLCALAIVFLGVAKPIKVAALMTATVAQVSPEAPGSNELGDLDADETGHTETIPDAENVEDSV